MLSRLLQPEIQSLIEERQLSILKEILTEWTPADIAELLVELSEKECVLIFRLLSKELAADTFEYMEFDSQMDLLKSMGREETAVILNEMDPDDRTALFEELPSTAAKQLIQLLSPEERKTAVTLLGYPENSVGRMMTPDYIAIKPSYSIQRTLDYIREHGKNKETLNIVYVVDEKGKLIDDIKIKDVLLAPIDSKVADLMDENFVGLHVFDDQEIAVEAFKKYDRIALPVVDRAGILIGIVTVDDVFDVAEEEATEDIQKLAAVQALDESYITISLLAMMKKRGSWLALLFVGEMLTASAMAMFEYEISKAVVLALFVPLIISSGGNSGSQAATLVIRALSLGEITLKDWFNVFKREINYWLSTRWAVSCYWIFKNYCLGSHIKCVWGTLVFNWINCQYFISWCCALGNIIRLNASIFIEKIKIRSSYFICSSCCNNGRCNWFNNLFFTGTFYS